MSAQSAVIREAVYENLNHALENGSFEPDGDLHGASARDIALDLTVYSDDFSPDLTSVDELEPYVQAWLDDPKTMLLRL